MAGPRRDRPRRRRSAAAAACTSVCSTPSWDCCLSKRSWAGKWDIDRASDRNRSYIQHSAFLTVHHSSHVHRHPQLDRTPARHRRRGRRRYGLEHRARLGLAALGDAAVCRVCRGLRGGDLSARRPPRLPAVSDDAGRDAAGAGGHGAGDDRPGDAVAEADRPALCGRAGRRLAEHDHRRPLCREAAQGDAPSG